MTSNIISSCCLLFYFLFIFVLLYYAQNRFCILFVYQALFHAFCQFQVKTKTAPKPSLGAVLQVVIPARIELATYRLGGGCSILLSYGTITTAQAELKPFHPSCTKYYTAKTEYWQ